VLRQEKLLDASQSPVQIRKYEQISFSRANTFFQGGFFLQSVKDIDYDEVGKTVIWAASFSLWHLNQRYLCSQKWVLQTAA